MYGYRHTSLIEPRDLQIGVTVKDRLIAVGMLFPLTRAKCLEGLWFP